MRVQAGDLTDRPIFTPGLQVCQVLQDGERQRVSHPPEGFRHPLRRAGVRERESWDPAEEGIRGGFPCLHWGLEEALGTVAFHGPTGHIPHQLPILCRAELSDPPQTLPAPRPLSQEPRLNLSPHPSLLVPLSSGLALYPYRLASSISSLPSSAPWPPSPLWEW